MHRTAVEMVNVLTAGVDGVNVKTIPADAAGRRSLAKGVTVLAHRRLSEDDLSGLVILAAALRRVFEHCDIGDAGAAAQHTNQLLQQYASAPQLIEHDGSWRLHFHRPGVGVVAGWGAGCAAGLALAISDGEADRLGVCIASPCDRVFVDTSRNGNRRFCSTRCANRWGVTAHRARQRQQS